ncbi:MAG: hypothetical protein Q7L55_08540 [Actinomycetota bacterium]|nr:hypothetical protein [Actinomycetota bacterium]
MMYWFGDGNGWSGGNWWGMGFMMIFWIALIGLGIWAVIRYTQGGGKRTSVTFESPRAILDRRFAAGEIDAEAYAHARRLLEHPGSPADG